jgi:kynurenine formamidase
MAFTEDPYTGLRFYELSHVWDRNAPSYPGQADVAMRRGVKHAQHGVLAWHITTSLHTGTHMIAPLHTIQKGADLASLPTDRLFGNGIVLDIPKKSHETITEDDLEKAAGIKEDDFAVFDTPCQVNVFHFPAHGMKEGDFVVINTGWHHRYSDALEYYGEAPGLTEGAAAWLVAKKVPFVAIDTPFADHPLATNMANHRGGPHMKRLAAAYKAATGKDPESEHGKWNIALRTLSGAGIPVVVQAGGDLDDLRGKRATFAATPWKLEKGDACPVRFVAMTDPSGRLRIDSEEVWKWR